MRNRIGSQVKYTDFLKQSGGGMQVYRGRRGRRGGAMPFAFLKKLTPFFQKAAPLMKQMTQKFAPMALEKGAELVSKQIAKKAPKKFQRPLQMGLALSKKLISKKMKGGRRRNQAGGYKMVKASRNRTRKGRATLKDVFS